MFSRVEKDPMDTNPLSSLGPNQGLMKKLRHKSRGKSPLMFRKGPYS